MAVPLKGGVPAGTVEWAKHLKPAGKREFWKRVRRAAKKDTQARAAE